MWSAGMLTRRQACKLLAFPGSIHSLAPYAINTLQVINQHVTMVCSVGLETCASSTCTSTQAALAHRHISTGTLPCHERNRARPYRSGPELPGMSPMDAAATGGGDDDEVLNEDDGFAVNPPIPQGVSDIDDEDDDQPLHRMVDDEYVDEEDVEEEEDDDDEDEEREDPNDPFYNELLKANTKRREFLLRQYIKGLRPDDDAEAVYNKMVEENEEAGWFRFRLKLLDMNRIIKVTRQGRIQRFSAMVLVANGEGAVGIGKGKSLNMNEALRKAHMRAMKNHVVIPRYRRATVYFPTTYKYVKSRVNIWPKSIGKGIVANHTLSDILKMIGFTDIGVKVIGSTHPRNVVKALLGGLLSIPDPCDIARDQGKVVLELAPGKYHIPIDELVVRLGLRHPQWPNLPEGEPIKERPRYEGPVRPWWYI